MSVAGGHRNLEFHVFTAEAVQSSCPLVVGPAAQGVAGVSRLFQSAGKIVDDFARAERCDLFQRLCLARRAAGDCPDNLPQWSRVHRFWTHRESDAPPGDRQWSSSGLESRLRDQSFNSIGRSEWVCSEYSWPVPRALVRLARAAAGQLCRWPHARLVVERREARPADGLVPASGCGGLGRLGRAASDSSRPRDVAGRRRHDPRILWRFARGRPLVVAPVSQQDRGRNRLLRSGPLGVRGRVRRHPAPRGFSRRAAPWRPILAWQIVALLAWTAVALTSSEEVALRVPTLLYTLLVAATPGFATALAVQRPIYRWMALGGALFLASDILLAWQVFHASFPGIDELTWINYGGGEMLIVYGAIAGLWRHTTEQA